MSTENISNQDTAIRKNVGFLDPDTTTPSSGSSGFRRRLSSIFPAYLRKQTNRRDSIFNSESTTTLWPFYIEEKLPTIFGYNDSNNNNKDSKESKFKFGWINGVYIRTVLNIWGVMLFLRMGWMTGHAGIAISLVIVLVSTLVTLFTTISMSAICTNGEVGTGGIYYMISRSLGAEAGSMIGIIFSFANAVLVSANLVGAAETATEILGIYNIVITNDVTNDIRIIGAILLIIVAIVPLISMEWEAKAMLVLLLLLLASLVNYLVGTFLSPSDTQISQGFVGWSLSVGQANIGPRFETAGFFQIFGVFFPSVIGIFTGASMSGDLRDPNAAIPKGTFLAILTTSSVYMVVIICLGFTVYPYASGNIYDAADHFRNSTCRINDTCAYGLIPEYQTMTLSAGFGPLIYVGIFAATLSSALGSYVCAPRIFQALCEDNLVPYIHFFAKGYGKMNDPRRGYCLTFVISLAFICIGSLNSIAPIISNFFMASFFLVNMACFHSSYVDSPSFRPTFKYYNEWLSLLTSVFCIVIMFLLDYITALVTVLVMGVIYVYMTKRGPDVNWGSSKRSQVYNSALSSALKLNHIGDHVKNFRPSILLLTGNPSARIPLVEFANSITKNKSLLLIGHIVNTPINVKLREKVLASQYEWMARRRIKAFYLLLESESLKSGSKAMIQISGLGRKLRANIVMLGIYSLLISLLVASNAMLSKTFILLIIKGYKSSWMECLTEDLIDYYNVLTYANENELSIMILRIQEGLDYADFFEPNDDIQTQKLYPEIDIPDIDEPNGNFSINIEPAIAALNRNPKSRKAQFESIKDLVPNDAIEAINQFNERQKKGTIDIWWLADDGGLTILIPYILSLNEIWRDCYLRILTMAKDSTEINETKDNLAQLISKLRIPCSDILVFAESDLEVNPNKKKYFEDLISKFLVKKESEKTSEIYVTMDDIVKYREMTNRHLKLRELLEENSNKTSLIVMTLPVPTQYISVSLYMSWLEVLTEEMPPFLLIRGNKKVISI